jgi:hypothetical protein
VPLLGVFLALAVPRLLIVYLWLVTEWFEGIFDSIMWPVLGFIFLPTTLLWYTAVQTWFDGAWGVWQIVGLVIALLLDTSSGNAGRERSRRSRGSE